MKMEIFFCWFLPKTKNEISSESSKTLLIVRLQYDNGSDMHINSYRQND